jgi:hypothetical protein
VDALKFRIITSNYDEMLEDYIVFQWEWGGGMNFSAYADH